jgi:hypothetical protein
MANRVPEECCDEIAELIDRCLATDAAARPTAHELVNILTTHLSRHMEEILRLSRLTSNDSDLDEMGGSTTEGLKDDQRKALRATGPSGDSSKSSSWA